MPPHARLFIWPGQELVGCRRSGASKDHIENGCLYTVTKIEEQFVTVQLSPSMVPEGKVRPPITLSDFEAGQLLRYAYARTVAGCQGLTFANKRVLLMEARHPRFCKRKLYVAASRCTDPEMFHVATMEETRNIIGVCEEYRNEQWSKPPEDPESLTKIPPKRAAPETKAGTAKRQKK